MRFPLFAGLGFSEEQVGNHVAFYVAKCWHEKKIWNVESPRKSSRLEGDGQSTTR